jgi:hypothetical protein
MPRLNFGAFLAPHNPVGENPLLHFRQTPAASPISRGGPRVGNEGVERV